MHNLLFYVPYALYEPAQWDTNYSYFMVYRIYSMSYNVFARMPRNIFSHTHTQLQDKDNIFALQECREIISNAQL